jgi:hypothetical protein
MARMGEERKLYKVLVAKPEGKRPLEKPRRRWENGITLDLVEIGLGGLDWIQLAQDRDRWRAIVSAVMNLRVSYVVYSSFVALSLMYAVDLTIDLLVG